MSTPGSLLCRPCQCYCRGSTFYQLSLESVCCTPAFSDARACPVIGASFLEVWVGVWLTEAHLLFAPLHALHGSTHTVHDAPLDSAKCPSTQAVHVAVCPELGAVHVARLSIPLHVVLSTNTPAISSHFTTDCLAAVAPGGTKCPSAAFVHLPSDAAVQRVFPG